MTRVTLYRGESGGGWIEATYAQRPTNGPGSMLAWFPTTYDDKHITPAMLLDDDLDRARSPRGYRGWFAHRENALRAALARDRRELERVLVQADVLRRGIERVERELGGNA